MKISQESLGKCKNEGLLVPLELGLVLEEVQRLMIPLEPPAGILAHSAIIPPADSWEAHTALAASPYVDNE